MEQKLQIAEMQALNRFIGRQRKKGKMVNISDPDKERIVQRRYKKGFRRFLGDLGDALAKFKVELGINKFLIIDEAKNPTTVEFIPKKSEEKIPESIVINLAKIRPGTPKYREISNQIIREAKKIKEAEEIEIRAPEEILPEEKIPFEEAKAGKIPVVKMPKAISEEKRGILLELGSNVKIYLPDNEGVQRERREVEKGIYSLYLSKSGKGLPIWLDTQSKLNEISIAGKDYRIRGDRLAELAPWGMFDLVRKEVKGREFPLEKKGDDIIIDLEKIEGNDELTQFLAK